MIASKTTLPVLGVPVTSKALGGLDSLLSIVADAQGRAGGDISPWARPGAANAGLFAVALLARTDAVLAARLAEFRRQQTAKVEAMKLPGT